MDLFTWTRRFETDFDVVDEQHRGLVDLINAAAHEVSGGGSDHALVLDLVEQLRRYAQIHFTDEERMITEAGLDSRHVEVHLQAHREFVEDISALEADIRAGEAVDPAHMLNYLSHWLAYHILGVDQSMARQIRAVNAGATPLQAYRAEEQRDDSAIRPMLDAVNGLLDTVRQRNLELEELNRSLERKVAERTRRLEQMSAELEILAMRDDLTRLENRRSALLWLDSIWDRDVPMGVIMLDADHFKAVNDTHGHEAGDLVLKRIAHCLRDCFRSDDVVSRLGGDEFLVVCPGTERDEAARLAAGVQRAIRELSVRDGATTIWRGSMSIGVATRAPHMADSRHLIRAADDAVYAAKAAGRNCVRIHGEADARGETAREVSRPA